MSLYEPRSDPSVFQSPVSYNTGTAVWPTLTVIVTSNYTDETSVMEEDIKITETVTFANDKSHSVSAFPFFNLVVFTYVLCLMCCQ